MNTKWQGEPKQWRVRGKSKDGLRVTLGSYDTESEAQADSAKFISEGYYRDITVERIERAPGPPAPPA
ncbi:MAG TPA: hypothetical protein PK920_13840 [Phycisphaerae bacterium]|jgi:hypothetical protein|nr:hypothetical protein [Phycisphaerae bacterium]HPC23550.1 hypothetical protein [Phycisphaerae bacterium]HRS29397.1 hypothetical protein [Phycisphaerae bacterium]HRT42784.1 hypothetical protein [Phycisphaerae bacterium]